MPGEISSSYEGPKDKKYLTLKLLKDIEKGGLIIAPRRSGKTSAIIKLMKKNINYIVSCPIQSMLHNYKYHLGHEFINMKNRFIGPDLEEIRGRTEKVILDECFWHPLFPLVLKNEFPNFHCAISSSPFNRMVIYNSEGKRTEVNRDDIFE